jgi:hypothetical protein
MRARTGLFTLVSGALLFLASAGAEPLAVPAVPAAPQATTATGPQHFHGTVAEFDGPFLTLKLTGKKTVTLGMTADTRVIHNRVLRLADLQPGAYVGVAALRSADGKFRAQGIRVYPANMRGMGEGAYAIDPANAARLIFNGTVVSAVPGGIGGVLTIGFHGAVAPAAATECTGRAAPGGCTGTAEIQFARGVPIIAIEQGNVSLLLPGATVSASAAPDATGTLVATAITVERDAPAPKAPLSPLDGRPGDPAN